MLTPEQGAALHGQIANALKDADDGLTEVVKTRLRRLQELVDDLLPDVDADEPPEPEDEDEEDTKLVRVSWFHREEFERDFRVPVDLDDEEQQEELLDQITNLEQDELTEAFEGCTEREITEVTDVSE